ncbi:shikimate kinase [Lentibacillus salinarum]|uniref:Shikimate kinase n=1 Tax=Lentibacillus salinarum TaxID=446820 RepID=A0ABW3ZS76_9BACI
MRTVYLIGFMGSGKSTVGELLHRKSGISYLDTDQMVVDQYGDIASIFEKEGETQFRAYETEMLTRIPDKNYVVSTGGGIVEREENHTLMKQNGMIIHLDTSFDEITGRLGEDPTRPLWGQYDSDKYKLYIHRRNCYTTLADFTIMTDQKTPETIVTEMMAFLS